jgi:hypothetical protein
MAGNAFIITRHESVYAAITRAARDARTADVFHAGLDPCAERFDEVPSHRTA